MTNLELPFSLHKRPNPAICSEVIWGKAHTDSVLSRMISFQSHVTNRQRSILEEVRDLDRIALSERIKVAAKPGDDGCNDVPVQGQVWVTVVAP